MVFRVKQCSETYISAMGARCLVLNLTRPATRPASSGTASARTPFMSISLLGRLAKCFSLERFITEPELSLSVVQTWWQ